VSPVTNALRLIPIMTYDYLVVPGLVTCGILGALAVIAIYVLVKKNGSEDDPDGHVTGHWRPSGHTGSHGSHILLNQTPQSQEENLSLASKHQQLTAETKD